MASFAASDPKERFAFCTTGDWKYIAEGALNLVLRYIGQDEVLKGYVLRVRKDNPEASGGSASENPWEESLRFSEKMVLPLIGRRYVQPAVEVPLKTGFMEALGQLIEEDRPMKRRVHTLDMNLKTGLLMIDNTLLPIGEGPSICFELKVKWGFLQDECPFVTHEVKKRVDRFSMHQYYKNVHGELDTFSKYCPLDLFSPDRSQIMNALNALVETPQNNFRMFVDGAMVYPDSKGHGGREEFADILKKYPATRGVDDLLENMATVLSREPLMERIKRMQMMDDCDIEGTWPIYEKILTRNETVLPLADGETLYPRERPTALPDSPEGQHDQVRRFMLSCTAKDCSTMVVVKPCERDSSAASQPSMRYEPAELEGARTIVEDKSLGYMYSISVVDLDPKPIEKMHHYFKLDKKIAETYAAAEKEGKVGEK